MAKKPKSTDQLEAQLEPRVDRDPLIITRSELDALTEAQQAEFRSAGGTVTEDPSLK